MKTAVVYYSLNGNTAFAAKKIAAGLGADLIEIKPVKAYPEKGFLKFFHGGKGAVLGEKPALKPYSFDAGKYEQIIIGFPVWAGNITPPIRTFAAENQAGLKEKRIAAFACQSGRGAESAFGHLKDCLGIESFSAQLVLIDPAKKPVPENEEKIRKFCEACR